MANRLIAIHSSTDGAGKSTLADVLHYLAWKKQVDNNQLSIIPRLTFEEFMNLDGPDKVSPYETKSFADLPNDIYEKITGVRFKDLPREQKERRRDEFVAMCEDMKKHVFQDEAIWANALMLQWKEDSAWIIDDLRFECELDALWSKGADFFEIRDPKRKTKDYDLDITADAPANVYVIEKQDTVEELVALVEKLNIF